MNYHTSILFKLTHKNDEILDTTKHKYLLSVFCIAIFLVSQIAACGLTPIKKSATRKNVHSKEKPVLTEVNTPKKVTARPEVIEESLPDSKLIFASDRSGNLEIWISNLDGSKAFQLTDDDKYESNWPRVSPDRSKVLFYRAPRGAKESSYEQFSLWQVDIYGNNPIELIPKGSYGWISQGVADWSPDGTKIVMAAADKTQRWQLYVTNANGKNPQRISKRDSHFLDPSWSPDGSKIVYSAFPQNYKGSKLNKLEIFIANADGSNEKQLTFDSYRDHDPYWSPNGEWIAFEAQTQPLYWLLGKWALRVIPAKGGKTIDILNDGHVNTLPRWSPDSSQLYFHRLRFKKDKKFGLWRINQDGSNLTNIINAKTYKSIQADIF